MYKREITLISGGYTNPTAWPGGKITVYPWDNEMDNWVVENARRMSKEELVFGMLSRCCNLNGAKIDEFVADEMNLVLLVSRARLSNDIIEYTATCPFCGTKKEEKATIPDELEPIGTKTADYPGFDEIELPIIKDKLKVRPLTVKDERAIVTRSETDKKLTPDTTLRTLQRIVSINESRPDNLEELASYYRALCPKDAKFLETESRRLSPHLNTAIPHKCDECLKEFDHPLDFSAQFFR
jgi:hypothetical protein